MELSHRFCFLKIAAERNFTPRHIGARGRPAALQSADTRTRSGNRPFCGEGAPRLP